MCSDLPEAHANFPGLISLQATHASHLMQSYSIPPPPQYPPQDGWERTWKTTKCWVCLGRGASWGDAKSPGPETMRSGLQCLACATSGIPLTSTSLCFLLGNQPPSPLQRAPTRIVNPHIKSAGACTQFLFPFLEAAALWTALRHSVPVCPFRTGFAHILPLQLSEPQLLLVRLPAH